MSVLVIILVAGGLLAVCQGLALIGWAAADIVRQIVEGLRERS